MSQKQSFKEEGTGVSGEQSLSEYYGNKLFAIRIRSYTDEEGPLEVKVWEHIQGLEKDSLINSSEALVQLDKSELVRKFKKPNTSVPQCDC